ncbi:HipA domain-containing protein [bacterium]|nr:HipA domain-containing protein [bacterium]
MESCLSCGKPLTDEVPIHKACLRKIFKVNYQPQVNISLAEVSIQAQKMAGKLSISGVQPKLSMRLNRQTKELEVVTTDGEFILKPQVITFLNLPQNEQLCMTIAAHLGIDIPPHMLLRLKDQTWAYLVKRFDRMGQTKIHQEDFFQILGKQDKYQGSVEEIGKKLKMVSSVPGLDVQLFFERILFYFIIGNGDAHFKNFSIYYTAPNYIRLAPAYDIVSSKLLIPGEEDSALSINGKKNKITVEDFKALADYLGIPPKVVANKFLDQEKIIKEMILDSKLTEEEKDRLLRIVRERMARLISSRRHT